MNGVVLPAYQYSEKPNKLNFSDIKESLYTAIYLFSKQPVHWLLIFFLAGGAAFVLQQISLTLHTSILSNLIISFSLYLFVSGLSYCAFAQLHHQGFKYKDCLNGLNYINIKSLIIISGIATILIAIDSILAMIIAQSFDVISSLSKLESQNYNFLNINETDRFKITAWLVALILSLLPAIFLTIFTSPLIILRFLEPLIAIQSSFEGAFKNFIVLIPTVVISALIILLFVYLLGWIGLIFLAPLLFLFWFAIFDTVYLVK